MANWNVPNITPGSVNVTLMMTDFHWWNTCSLMSGQLTGWHCIGCASRGMGNFKTLDYLPQLHLKLSVKQCPENTSNLDVFYCIYWMSFFSVILEFSSGTILVCKRKVLTATSFSGWSGNWYVLGTSQLGVNSLLPLTNSWVPVPSVGCVSLFCCEDRPLSVSWATLHGHRSAQWAHPLCHIPHFKVSDCHHGFPYFPPIINVLSLLKM